MLNAAEAGEKSVQSLKTENQTNGKVEQQAGSSQDEAKPGTSGITKQGKDVKDGGKQVPMETDWKY